MAENDEPRDTRVKILVAEDNPINQKMTCNGLRSLGFEPELAINGEEAVIKGKTGEYVLILMDINMPVLDGLEAAKKIRAFEASRGYRTPIIAMSALTQKWLDDQVRDAEMDGYLEKPFELHQLKYILKEQLGSDPGGAKKEKGYYFAELFDHRHLLERCMGDRELAVHLTETFLEELPAYLKNIDQALEAGNADGYTFHLYKLRGAAGNLCAGELFHLTGELLHQAAAGDQALKRRGMEKLHRSADRFRAEVDPQIFERDEA
jgi:CheY-like chemotaxis protein